MNIFGVGPLELLLILLVVLIIFGPNDLQKAGKSIGKALNNLVRSEGWRTLNQTSKELKNLPNRLMRESGFEDIQETGKELNQSVAELKRSIPAIKPQHFPVDPQGDSTDTGVTPTRSDSSDAPHA